MAEEEKESGGLLKAAVGIGTWTGLLVPKDDEVKSSKDSKKKTDKAAAPAAAAPAAPRVAVAEVDQQLVDRIKGATFMRESVYTLFMARVQDLASVPGLDRGTRIKSALAVVKKTPAEILNALDGHCRVLEEQRGTFSREVQKQVTVIQGREKTIEGIEADIARLREQAEGLRAQNVEDQKAIDAMNANFDAAHAHVTAEIEEDRQQLLLLK